ncbi:4Fe-4S dicluster domain-containing protein [Anaerosporobacter faecicola]|uniref:4Fe-4S dicluster domain-containing protein n=1 Tax=Anaerosporobacter faecicola TaxID=2718714 RepID=UPI001439DBDD|nr:4Fe-4S dicluster domain-containing protein [Anaerosporobacter faecicola]
MMKEYPIITKRICRKNKAIRVNQKQARKQWKRVRGGTAKTRILKILPGLEAIPFVNLMEDTDIVKNQNGKSQGSIRGTFTKEEFLGQLKEQSITGLSGDGFSTATKVESFLEAKKERKTLIVNGVECDPGLIHDQWLLQNHYQQICEGIRAVVKILGIKHVIVATKFLEKKEGMISFVRVPDQYPMGEEHLLIQFLTGVELTRKQIPAKEGFLVLNVQTIYQINDMLHGKKHTGRFLTVSNLQTAQATVVRAPYSMRARDILVAVYGEQQELTMYLGGGAMSAHRMDEQELLTPKTNIIAYQSKVSYQNEQPCKGCGACTKRCPANLPVHKMIKAMEKGNWQEAKGMLQERCMHCGTCSYYCHAGKNVMELIGSLND